LNLYSKLYFNTIINIQMDMPRIENIFPIFHKTLKLVVHVLLFLFLLYCYSGEDHYIHQTPKRRILRVPRFIYWISPLRVAKLVELNEFRVERGEVSGSARVALVSINF
jgi:hypothetical protein